MGISVASATGKKSRSGSTLLAAACHQRGKPFLLFMLRLPGRREAMKAALKVEQWFQGLVHAGVNYLPHKYNMVAN